jgi:16S rRNA (adenine1518-N6/adenine1519-N6)-dimethyltransferase
MEKHGMRFSKSLGQNFLVNPSVCPRMAQMGGAGPEVCALEIGPGVGALTAELAKSCRKVACVEIDKRLPPLLEEALADYTNVEIIRADVLKTDLRALIAEQFGGAPVIVCANLPYYITSPILMKLLEERLPVRSITVMVQKEAAQRLCAPMPSRQAGAITAAVRYYAEPELLFSVQPGSFLPPPRVESAVIRLSIRPKPPVPVRDEQTLFRVIRGAFSQRRKTLLNSLTAALSLEKREAERVLEHAQVAPGARAEQLGLEAFARIADAMTEG